MSILTIELVAVIFFAVKCFVNTDESTGKITSVGLLAAITGILGQLLGLFQAFEVISEVGSVSPALLAGGLKVSMITTMYGVIIYMISLILALLLKARK